jgi:hypothetical protein
MCTAELKWPVVALTTLMVMTSSSAIIQAGSLALIFLAVKIVMKEKLLPLVQNLAKIFVISVLVWFYYAHHLPSFGIESGDYEKYTKEFFDFWLTKEKIPILSVLGIAMVWGEKKLQGPLIVFTTALFLYLISPVLNFLVIKRGYFFSSRQYIFYDLVIPFFIIGLAMVLPHYCEKIEKYFSQK